MQVGFLGFGEAAFVISTALLSKGLTKAVAYDCNYLHPTLGETIRQRAAHSGIELLPSNAALVAGTDIILSLVTASSAEEAAKQTALHLREGHLFCDCNSVSPATKISVARIIERAGGLFVEAAIMAPVQADLGRVPVLMNGPNATRLSSFLQSFGMNIEVMNQPDGTAAAIKMCRSIVIKGLEALLLECRATAAHFGCETAVLRSLEATNPEFNWTRLSEYMMGRILDHGVRRSAEMNEVAAMQRGVGLPATMSVAIAEVQNWPCRLPGQQITTASELISALARRTST